MKDHDEIFAKILKKIDQRFMSGDLNNIESALHLLLHNVRDVPDRPWKNIVNFLESEYLSDED
ncbi:hypothetical protein CL645_03500 [bacterium]|nr:hypothetical protein [bacterium]|tara:strand:- start:781 stop:969 length:189 start_codon:yes stop_codon:yes gene_type:complete